MFLAPQIAGYDEVRDFQKRMAEKLAWNPANSGFASMMQQPGAGQGMAELAKESAKLDGVPVHQITRMGTLEAITAAANAPPQPEGQQKQGPTAGQAANSAATDSAASAIADRLGKLGGFGGFGKKKKADADQPPADAPPQGGAAAASGERRRRPAGDDLRYVELLVESGGPVQARSAGGIQAGGKQNGEAREVKVHPSLYSVTVWGG